MSRSRARVGAWALVREARTGILQRPGRSVMTALGTVIGVAVLIGVLALTSAAAIQVSRQFDLQEATLIRVKQDVSGRTRVGSLGFDAASPTRAMAIQGATGAMVMWQSDLKAANPPSSIGAPLIVVSAGMDGVTVPTYSQGRGFDVGQEERHARVAVLGSGAAQDLNIHDVSGRPTVTIDGVRFNVIGIISDVQRHPDFLGAVLIPMTTALELWGDPPPETEATMAVAVSPGAAQVVGEQLPLAASAANPGAFIVEFPPDPQILRQAVSQQLAGLLVMLAGVCLVVGVIGIANTTFVAVVERTGEIGLRRAMGASPSDVARQFVLEAIILGCMGGLVGDAVAVLAVVAICAGLGWTVVVPLWLVVGGPLVGLLSGLVGGLVPSLRASRIEPVEALRS